MPIYPMRIKRLVARNVELDEARVLEGLVVRQRLRVASARSGGIGQVCAGQVPMFSGRPWQRSDRILPGDPACPPASWP